MEICRLLYFLCCFRSCYTAFHNPKSKPYLCRSFLYLLTCPLNAHRRDNLVAPLADVLDNSPTSPDVSIVHHKTAEGYHKVHGFFTEDFVQFGGEEITCFGADTSVA